MAGKHPRATESNRARSDSFSRPRAADSAPDLDNGIALRRDNGKDQTLEAAERAHILTILKETRWVLAGPRGAAARLGMNRSTLQFRLKKLGIVRPDMRTSLD